MVFNELISLDLLIVMRVNEHQKVSFVMDLMWIATHSVGKRRFLFLIISNRLQCVSRAWFAYGCTSKLLDSDHPTQNNGVTIYIIVDNPDIK